MAAYLIRTPPEARRVEGPQARSRPPPRCSPRARLQYTRIATATVASLLAAAGHTLPPDTVNSRLVHLPDASRRSEVIVIYIEDMAPLGKTSSEFLVDGKVSDAWAPVGRGVLERAMSRISFERVSP